MWRMTPELERGIASARVRFGDGPYLLVEQTRSLDIDGFNDSVALHGGYADLDRARAELAARFAWLCDQMHDDAHWRDEPMYTLPIAIDAVEGVRVVEHLGKKRKAPDGFNAETVVVQLLEIATPPVVGEPLFRALRYDAELARFLSR